MSYMKKYALRTEFEGMHDITAQVQEAVKESGIQEGFCIVHCNHTTAGLLVTSFWDKRGHVDFMEELDKIVPATITAISSTPLPMRRGISRRLCPA